MPPRREDFEDIEEYELAVDFYAIEREQRSTEAIIAETNRIRVQREEARRNLTANPIFTTSNFEDGTFTVSAGTQQRTTGWTSSFNPIPQVDTDAIERIVDFYKPKKKAKMDEKVLKQRHLGRDERSMFHQPKSDWCESPKGDICKSACSLEVSDLVAKIK